MKPKVLTALIMTADKFEDLEVIVPMFRLQEANIKTIISAPNLNTISGEHGYTLKPDISIIDAKPDDYDLLLIPGGYPNGAPATVRKIPHALSITQSFMSKNKPVASICHGPWTLASADVIKGRRLTSYWHDGVPEDVKLAGGIWEDKPVVVDRNLVTSRWPFDLPLFNQELMRLVDQLIASGHN